MVIINLTNQYPIQILAGGNVQASYIFISYYPFRTQRNSKHHPHSP